MSAIPDVRHNAAEHRFEIDTPEGTALLSYSQRDGSLDLSHTEVPGPIEGQGYGAALAKAALDHARAQQLRVIPSCPFVAAYVRRHKEYASLVA
jgi:hypothetical protein